MFSLPLTRCVVSALVGLGLHLVSASCLAEKADLQQRLRFEEISMDELELEGDTIGSVGSITQDKRGFMWFGGENGLARYDGQQFVVYQNEKGNDHSISSNEVLDLVVDQKGELWVATNKGLNRYDALKDRFERYLSLSTEETFGDFTISHNQATSLAVDADNRLYVGTGNGVTIVAPDRQRSTHYRASIDYGGRNSNLVGAIDIDHNGRVLVGSFGQGLQVLDLDKKKYYPFPLDPQYQHYMHERTVSGILHDHQNRIWLSSVNKPLIRIDPDGKVVAFTHDPQDPRALSSNSTWAVFEDAQGSIWVATDNTGFAIFNEQTQGFTNITHDPYDRSSITSNQVRSFYQDKVGDIWVGTFTSEINYHNGAAAIFKHFYHSPGSNSLSNNGVLSFAQSDENSIWIGTEKGFNRYNPQTNEFTRYTTESTNGALVSDAVLSIVPDQEGILWLGTTMGGLHSFNPATHTFKHLGLKGAGPTVGYDNFIWDILIDTQNIWAGTLFGGLSKYDLKGNKLGHYRAKEGDPGSLQSNFVSQVVKDHKGRLLLGTLEGLALLDPKNESISHVLKTEDATRDPHAYRVTAAYIDSNERTWVGLHGRGIRVFDAEYQLIKTIEPSEGLASAMINSFIEDDAGDIWIATHNGIARINPETYVIDNFQRQHGVISNNHNRDATLKDHLGNLYVGSTDGFTVFHPDRLQTAPTASNVVLSSLYVNSARVSEYGEESPLQQTLLHTESLVLSHEQRSFGFDFALLSFRSAKYNRYSYFLEGLDKDWSEPSRSHSAFYTHVPAGRYTFHVKGQDSTGQWSTSEGLMKVTVLPAPWRTWWAYIIYGLALLGAVLLAVNHQRKKLELEKEKSLNAELINIAKLKNTFLANTSHELRTPLNGIIGISEYLVDYSKDKQDAHLESHLSKLTSSGKRLLNLINDVLDFAKLESNTLELRKEPVSILQLTCDAISIVQPSQTEKSLTIHNRLMTNSPCVLGDPNRLQQVMLNLLSNAIKYTERGQIIISNSIDGPNMSISIEDTGTGIGETQLKNVFAVFNQSAAEYGKEQGGIGLGLAITKQLINLHGGEINVESKLEQGSIFTFTLPLAKPGAHAPPAAVQPTDEPQQEPMKTQTNYTSDQVVLVVDDDAINRMVIKGILEKSYRVLEADDGQGAVDLIERGETVHLIVMDIMMPRLSGFEACKRIRQSHSKERLPIIFVTARKIDDDLSVGFEVGGDDFIEKPVSKHKLLPRIKHLLPPPSVESEA